MSLRKEPEVHESAYLKIYNLNVILSRCTHKLPNPGDLHEIYILCGADPLVAVPHTSMCMGVDSFTERTGGPDT